MEKRIEWIDTLKGLGMLFIIFGHHSLQNAYVYSFHVPLFFFASGYLFDSDRYHGYVHFLRRKAHTVLLPYLVFYLYSYLWMIISFSLRAHLSISSIIATDHYRPLFWDKLGGLLYGGGAAANDIGNPLLWFLPCFFVAENLFYFAHRITGDDLRKLSGSIAFLSIVAYGESLAGLPALPWSIDAAFTATVFFGIGYCIKVLQRRNDLFDRVRASRAVLAATLAGLLICSAGFSLLNGRIDMSGNHYGSYSFFYASAFAGIFFYSLLSRYYLDGTFLAWLGRNTIVLLGLSQSMGWQAVKLVDAVSGIFTTRVIEMNDIVLAALYTTVTVLCAVPLIVLFNRFLPFLIGRRAAAPR